MPFVKKAFTVKRKTPAFLYLMRNFELSQREAQRLIDRGRLLVEGVSAYDKAAKIEGDIEIVYFEAQSRGERPLFETPDIIVFDKPSGVLVHPKTMTTSYCMLDEIRHHAGSHANAVHRIDKETSGLLLASKHKEAEVRLKGLFESREIEKSYLAWADGKIDKPFEVSAPIKIRDNYENNKHKVSVSEKGKNALTSFVPLEYDIKLDATLLSCFPHTGRTHQIRVHLFHVKHPILGDPIYGTTFKAANEYLEGQLSIGDRLVETGAARLMLHAQSLRFRYDAKYEIQSKVDFGKMKQLIADKQSRRFNRN